MTLQYLPAIVGAITGSTAGIFAGRVMRRHLNRKPRAVHEPLISLNIAQSPHRHIYDSDIFQDQWESVGVIECACNAAGRFYSARLTASERALKLEAM